MKKIRIPCLKKNSRRPSDLMIERLQSVYTLSYGYGKRLADWHAGLRKNEAIFVDEQGLTAERKRRELGSRFRFQQLIERAKGFERTPASQDLLARFDSSQAYRIRRLCGINRWQASGKESKEHCDTRYRHYFHPATPFLSHLNYRQVAPLCQRFRPSIQ